MKPTWTNLRPAFCSAAMMRRHAAAVGASGFSQKTGLPASIAAMTDSSWAGPKLVTITASTSSAMISVAPSAKTVAPRGAATALARSASRSETATTAAPDSTFVMRAMCAWPIPPGPMIPILTVMSALPHGRRCAGAEVALREVLAGRDGVRQREGELDRVQILLDDDDDLPVQAREGFDQGLHLGLTGRRGHACATGDGLTEGPVLLMGLPDQVGVHRLDVHEPDALGVVAHDVDRVLTAVDDVPGVQAEGHVLRVGVGEEPVDVRAGLDMGVAVRVHDHCDAVLLLEDLPQLVGVVGVQLPLLLGQNPLVRELPGLVRPEHRWQVDQEVGANSLEHRRVPAHLELSVGPRLRLVQDAELGAGNNRQATLGHLRAELRRVGWEIPERPCLDVPVASRCHLVQRGLPVDLRGVRGEADAPGVGSGAHDEPVVPRIRIPRQVLGLS